MLRLSAVLPVLLSASLLGIAAGCGGSDGAEEESATPTEAVAEIREIKTLLEAAVDQVQAGDRTTAEETVGNAYLEHFEPVEKPLGDRDHDLMEELEEAISTDLRNDIKGGESAAEISTKVAEIEADLDRAVEVLQS